MKFSEYRQRLLKDPEYRQAVEELRAPFALGDAILRARLEKGWSQTELARRVGTKQANISRIEAGLANPTLKLIQSICSALDLEISFQPTRREQFSETHVVSESQPEPIRNSPILALNWPKPDIDIQWDTHSTGSTKREKALS
jgi:transcriptional regulator with XRE-family HTH domain